MESQWPRNVEQQIFPGFNVAIATFYAKCMCLATGHEMYRHLEKEKRTLSVPLHGFVTHLWRVMFFIAHFE